MSFRIKQTIPILRIFDVDKALEFYTQFLGFQVDWQHRFEDDLPLYMQVSRGDCVLHLSEHYGDGSPGVVVFIWTEDLEEYHREISAKQYRYLRPGLERTSYQTKCMEVIDPFGNRIRFSERVQDSA